MLRGGGASGAQTLKGRLGRLRKRGSDNGGRRLPRPGRGNRLRGDKARPPVQHAESLSSDEGTKESGSTKEASDDNNMRSPGSSNGKGLLSSPGGMATNSSDDSSERYDEEGDLESLRRWGKGVGEGGGGTANTNSVSTIARKTNPQASQLRSGLFRLTRKKPGRATAARLSAPSDSSSAPSTEEDDEERNHPGIDRLPTSRAAVGAPLLDDRQRPSSRGTLSGLGGSKSHGNGTSGRQRTTTGTETAATGSDSNGERTSRSSRVGGTPLPKRRRGWVFPSWPRFAGGWGRLGDTGEHEMAAVSGVGRPAAGMLENTMYSCFGGVVGRAWPGVGLALNPVLRDTDLKQVISSRAMELVTV